MLECILVSIYVYMIIAACVYLCCVIVDYIDYMKTGELDIQYPVTRWNTHLIAAFAASLWIVIVCLKIHNFIMR